MLTRSPGYDIASEVLSAQAPMNDRPGDALLAHYDSRLQQHGDTARGADWPDEEGRRVRFDVMLDVIQLRRREPIVVCDLGCGTGELLAHIRRRGLDNVSYVGVDRSARALEIARGKFPGAEFIQIDVNDSNASVARLTCDYLVANGLFTVKAGLSDQEMWAFLTSTLRAVWPQVRRGVAFNVMSKAVDWERDDLFHVSADALLRMLHDLAGRHLRLRADYGLYEYTAYAFKAESPVVEEMPPVAECKETVSPTIPVMRPRLPTAHHLMPYLERIDASRTYSNFGPLVTELETRLAAYFALPPGTVACASSGLSALVGAILGSTGRASRERPYAVVPGFTFVATAVAAQQCGYQPWLADIDPESWQLTPECVMQIPVLDEVGLVIPVATMGRPVEQAIWQEFSARTGIPVVIDGAAEFEALLVHPSRYLGDVPVALSFHATKSFGVGEGGAVVSSDAEWVMRASRALNFGFHGSRDSRSASTNGKMSEYHAAVGLAELDGWDAKLQAMISVAQRYMAAFASFGLAGSLHVTPDVAASYALFLATDADHAQRICDELVANGLDFRLWYGLGLHRQSYYADLPRDSLRATDDLAPRLIGLPSAPDLGDDVISRVARAVAACVATGDSVPREPV